MVQVALEHRGGVHLEVAFLAGREHVPSSSVTRNRIVAQRAAVGAPDLAPARRRARRASRGRIRSSPRRRTRRYRERGSRARRDRAAPPLRWRRRCAAPAAGSPAPPRRDHVGQERRRGLHERAVPRGARAARRGVPDRLQDLRNAHHERQPHPVEEAGLVGQRRRDEDAVFAVEPEMLDLHRRAAAEHVVAVEDALWLARRSRGEEELGARGGRWRPGRRARAGGPMSRSAAAKSQPAGGPGAVTGSACVRVDDDDVLQAAVPGGLRSAARRPRRRCTARATPGTKSTRARERRSRRPSRARGRSASAGSRWRRSAARPAL